MGKVSVGGRVRDWGLSQIGGERAEFVLRAEEGKAGGGMPRGKRVESKLRTGWEAGCRVQGDRKKAECVEDGGIGK